MHSYIHTHTHSHTHSHSLALTRTLTPTPTHTPTLTHTHSHTLTHSHTHMHTHTLILTLTLTQAARCTSHSPEQSQGAGTPEQGVYHSSHRHSGRDVLPVHCHPSSHERIPRSGTECAEWSPEKFLLPVRVYWRDGKRLHLCRHSTSGGCLDGPVRPVVVWCTVGPL